MRMLIRPQMPDSSRMAKNNSNLMGRFDWSRILNWIIFCHLVKIADRDFQTVFKLVRVWDFSFFMIFMFYEINAIWSHRLLEWLTDCSIGPKATASTDLWAVEPCQTIVLCVQTVDKILMPVRFILQRSVELNKCYNRQSTCSKAQCHEVMRRTLLQAWLAQVTVTV